MTSGLMVEVFRLSDSSIVGATGATDATGVTGATQ